MEVMRLRPVTIMWISVGFAVVLLVSLVAFLLIEGV